MSMPGPVATALGEEDAVARVSLGGEDELVVTPTRTLLYRADGLLSEETVEEYPHGASRLALSTGRRKSRLSLEYPLEGDREFTVPVASTDEVLHPVLAGLLSANDVTDAGETVIETFRFSELTVVVTGARLVKHVGEAVWDGDYEDYPYAAVSDLSVEEGEVATQLVLTVDGRQERLKVPAESATLLRHRLEEALCSFHGVESVAELGDDEGDGDGDDPTDPVAAFDSAVTPLSTGAGGEGEADAAVAADRPDPALREALSTLAEQIDEQRAILERQRRTVAGLRERLEEPDDGS